MGTQTRVAYLLVQEFTQNVLRNVGALRLRCQQLIILMAREIEIAIDLDRSCHYGTAHRTGACQPGTPPRQKPANPPTPSSQPDPLLFSQLSCHLVPRNKATVLYAASPKAHNKLRCHLAIQHNFPDGHLGAVE